MAVNQHSGAGKKARIHAHALAAIRPDDHKTLPTLAVALHFRAQLAQEAFLELQSVFYLHAHDPRLTRGDGPVYQKDVFELILTGRSDASALVDFARIEQVQNGQPLHVQHLVHALDAQAPLSIEEV